MIEILTLSIISLVGVALAIRRSRSRYLAGRYGRFAIFEHIVLPYPLFVGFGWAGYVAHDAIDLTGEQLVLISGFVVLIAIVGMAFVFPPAIFLVLILFMPFYVKLPITMSVAILFTLKALWLLTGSAAIGNSIGFLIGYREQRSKEVVL
jgi:hypothetical protein